MFPGTFSFFGVVLDFFVFWGRNAGNLPELWVSYFSQIRRKCGNLVGNMKNSGALKVKTKTWGICQNFLGYIAQTVLWQNFGIIFSIESPNPFWILIWLQISNFSFIFYFRLHRLRLPILFAFDESKESSIIVHHYKCLTVLIVTTPDILLTSSIIHCCWKWSS